MNRFDHENLDVYQAAIKLVALIDEVVEDLPRGRAYLADQLQRSGTSVPLNIAEGAGEYAKAEKARFYRIAKRSATESAAILDECRCLNLLREQIRARSRATTAHGFYADRDGAYAQLRVGSCLEVRRFVPVCVPEKALRARVLPIRLCRLA